MRISVNAGHTKSGSGSGAVYKGFNEGEIVREVAALLIEKLKADGHEVHNSTVDAAKTQKNYLKEVVRLANNSGADLFVSIHCNASARHSGHGVECWTWKGNRVPQALKICENMADLGFHNRGIKDGRGFYVVKNTTARAVLVELFFLDNYTDRALYLKHGAEKIAAAIAKACKE